MSRLAKASTAPISPREAGVLTALLLGLCLALTVAVRPASAEKVGVAAAVNPDAFSSLSGAPEKQLNIGKSIFYNERINTTTSGLVQVLLVDGSTFTVGPGSDLVIDKFVYDPKKKTGQVVATFSKGAMRFVGGKISKNEGGVTVKTPAGALAIRGGMVQGNGKVWSFLYGVEMKLTGKNGQVFTVYQPGYTLDLTSGQPSIRPTTPADTASLMAALTNGGGGTGGLHGNNGTDVNPPPKQLLAETLSLQQLIADATATQIDDTLQREENNLPPTNPTDLTNPPPTHNPPASPPPPGPQIPKTGGSFNGYASGWYVEVDTPPSGGQAQEDSYNDDNVDIGRLANRRPEDVSVIFDAQQSTVSANFKVRSENLDFRWERGGAIVGFGGVGSVFTNNQNFAAAANLDQTFIRRGWHGDEVPVNSVTGALVSGGLLCSECDFMRFGSWTVALQYTDSHYNFLQGRSLNASNDYSQERTAVSLGWWVAGDLPTVGQLPTLGTATYSGSTIGTVFAMEQGGWAPHAATGKVGMNWNFADRAGTLEIKNFVSPELGAPSALNMSGQMRIPGWLDDPAMNRFRGGIGGTIGQNEIGGFARGSFSRNGADPTAGVVGNWNARSDNFRATGIFGAGRNGPVINPVGTIAGR
ncbi:MAG: FecR family protein [Methyloceanibacter sp.]